MAKQLGVTAHQSLPAATGNLTNPTVIHDLIGNLKKAPSHRPDACEISVWILSLRSSDFID
jgi:hypothetical protein